jgi:uncharacterized protein
MSGALYLDSDSFHDFTFGGRRVLFHLPTSALFELDSVGEEVLDFLKKQPRVTEGEVREWISTRGNAAAISPAQIAESIQDLRGLDILRPDLARQPKAPAIRLEDYPLNTLVLSVNNGCNLACGYCYKEDLQAPARGRKMDAATARRGVDLLLAESAARPEVNLAFLGGEPLTNLALNRDVVAYAEARCSELGRRVNFTLTTNATMLDEACVDFLDQHRFGISISIDGPKEIHDRRRKTLGGVGSYDVVAAKARMLLGRYRSRPVGARVTLAAGATDVVAIHRHLKEEIGFFEVGFAPVTTSVSHEANLSVEELAQVFTGLKALGREYVAAALDNRNIGFANMHQLLGELWAGSRKALPCGAGVGLLALDGEGNLNLCHRFAGSALPTFGDIGTGIARTRLLEFLQAAADLPQQDCAGCPIRNLCAGGCYHESYARYGDALAPTRHYCQLMREWVDFGLAAYVELQAKNPAYFTEHIGSRRG